MKLKILSSSKLQRSSYNCGKNTVAPALQISDEPTIPQLAQEINLVVVILQVSLVGLFVLIVAVAIKKRAAQSVREARTCTG